SFSPFTREISRWNPDGSGQLLGTLQGATRGMGNGISGDGSIVVGSSDINTGIINLSQVPVVWTASSGLKALELTTTGSANAVSADGSTLVGNVGSNAVEWTSNSGTWIATVLGLGSASSVDGDGSVIVGSIGAGDQFIWTSQNGYMDLQTYFAEHGIDTHGGA